MDKVRIEQLNESVRSFFAGIGDGLLVEDEAGRACYGVIPYDEAAPDEEQAAWQRLGQLQDKVEKTMQRKGIKEEDVDQLLQEDD